MRSGAVPNIWETSFYLLLKFSTKGLCKMGAYKVVIREKEIAVRENETILNASQRQAGGIFVGCKGGGCGMCKVKVVSGHTLDGIASKSVLSDDEHSAGYRLACQSMPITDMVVEPCREMNKILR